MSLVEALPPLRSRQWQLMVLVLLDALSVHRLPALTPVISDSQLVQKVMFLFPISVMSKYKDVYVFGET
jgi:hypothetical protein